MARATVTAKGQVTIPKEIRTQLGIKPGTKLEFYVDERGRGVMVPTIKIAELVGILRTGDSTMSVEAMDEAIADAVTRRAMQGR